MSFDQASRTELCELLAAHRPADDEEERDLETIQRFVSEHADPWDRRLEVGHLTCSAFVLDPAGRVLLTHHKKLEIWIQLGGHADDERSADAVALREACEESGLKDLEFWPDLRLANGRPALLDLDVHSIPARKDEPAHEHLDLRFLLRTGTPERVICDPRESRALEWVTPEEARRRGDPGLRRAVGKVERCYGHRVPPR